jgi:hypothetical protein
MGDNPLGHFSSTFACPITPWMFGEVGELGAWTSKENNSVVTSEFPFFNSFVILFEKITLDGIISYTPRS